MSNIEPTKRPLVVGHRGARYEKPENTIASFVYCLSGPLQANGIELDVELGGFGLPDRRVFLPVVHAESMVLDASRRKLIHSSPDPSNCWSHTITLEEAREIDAGSWFNLSMDSVRISLLDEVLSIRELQGDSGKVVLVELKSPFFWRDTQDIGPNMADDYIRAMVEKVVLVCEKALSDGIDVRLISFDGHLLRACPHRFQRILLLWGQGGSTAEKRSVHIRNALESGFNGIGMEDTRYLGQPLWSEELKSSGLVRMVYPVTPGPEASDIGLGPEHVKLLAGNQEAKWSSLMKLGVELLVTDFPNYATEFFRSYGS